MMVLPSPRHLRRTDWFRRAPPDHDAHPAPPPRAGARRAWPPPDPLTSAARRRTLIGHPNVNYGERYRNGERISTSFTESAINQVVSKRMVKQQQMQWTPEGAHLLLQVRTKVLNADWAATFRTWYPDFPPEYAAPMPTA